MDNEIDRIQRNRRASVLKAGRAEAAREKPIGRWHAPFRADPALSWRSCRISLPSELLATNRRYRPLLTAVSIALVAGLVWWFVQSATGRRIRAVVNNPELAGSVGIPVSNITTSTSSSRWIAGNKRFLNSVVPAWWTTTVVGNVGVSRQSPACGAV